MFAVGDSNTENPVFMLKECPSVKACPGNPFVQLRRICKLADYYKA